jgi:O-acetyl-ADP-ribose deacetylase (regulator of RNase III)
MQLIITHGDILSISAQTLICSANVGLRLTGGVGGAIRLKFGDAVADRIQVELETYLRTHGIANANVTDVIPTSGGGSPFQSIIHSVAMDGTYDSSIEIIRQTVAKALALCSTPHVALSALATGYGRMTLTQFGRAIAPLLHTEHSPIQTLTICLRHEDQAQELHRALPNHPGI